MFTMISSHSHDVMLFQWENGCKIVSPSLHTREGEEREKKGASRHSTPMSPPFDARTFQPPPCRRRRMWHIKLRAHAQRSAEQFFR